VRGASLLVVSDMIFPIIPWVFRRPWTIIPSRDRGRHYSLPLPPPSSLPVLSVSVSLSLSLTCWHSGMVSPRKRIPSSASRFEVSQSMHFTPLAPPMSWSIVTFPMTFDPWFFLSSARARRFDGTCDSRVSARVDAQQRGEDDDDDEDDAAAAARRTREEGFIIIVPAGAFPRRKYIMVGRAGSLVFENNILCFFFVKIFLFSLLDSRRGSRKSTQLMVVVR
jgi:hypothetical protein